MSSPSAVTAPISSKQPPILLYGLVIILLGLAVLFLLSRVKVLDRRTKELENTCRAAGPTLDETDVQDIVDEYLFTNNHLLSNIIHKSVSTILDAASAPAAQAPAQASVACPVTAAPASPVAGTAMTSGSAADATGTEASKL